MTDHIGTSLYEDIRQRASTLLANPRVGKVEHLALTRALTAAKKENYVNLLLAVDRASETLTESTPRDLVTNTVNGTVMVAGTEMAPLEALELAELLVMAARAALVMETKKD